MPCPGEGPCGSWDLDLGCCLTPSGTLPDPCILDGQVVSPSIIATSKLAASQLLWALTGRQFGCCQVKLRPLCISKCPDACSSLDAGIPGSSFPWTPVHLASGDWTNVSCSASGCSCTALCELKLPYPTCSVDEVKINGVVLGASTYAVTDFNTLVKTAGAPQKHLVKSPAGPLGGPIVNGDGAFNVTGSNAIGDTEPFNLLEVIDTPDVGSQYVIDFGPVPPTPISGVKDDPIIELQFPPGGGQITVNSPNNGRFKAFIITGGSSVTQAGSVLTVGPATQSNRAIRVGIRLLDNGGDGVARYTQFRYTINAAVGPIQVLGVQWTVDGVGCWPDCNNLTLPDTELDTWSVTVTYGKEIPQLVILAAQEMACELIKGCTGKPCKLPQRMSSVSRQGVTVSFLDDMAFLDKGLTGMYFVDLAARTYNPHRLMRRPAVYSPDSANKWKIQTWKTGDPTGPTCT